MFLIRVSGKIIEINPNNYLPFNIPGVEIVMALIIITFTGWLSLSFLGKKFFEIFNNVFKEDTYSENNLFCHWSNDRKLLRPIINKKVVL